MARCFFSGIESNFVTLANYDGVAVKNPTFGEYWASRAFCHAYDNGAALTQDQKNRCLTEVVRLRRKNLIPFWVIDSDQPSFKEDGQVVLRNVDEIMIPPVNHDEKELQILRLLNQRADEAGKAFKYAPLTIADQFALQIYDPNELVEWITSLLNDEYINLTDEGVAIFQEIGHEMIFDEFKSMISNSDLIRLTAKGRKLLSSAKVHEKKWIEGQIFWSWQSHYGKSSEEIKEALEFAAFVINKSKILKNPIFLEEAMRPEDGASRIDENIPLKIGKTRYFVGDVTPIMVWEDGAKSRRVLYPNPNVCIEVGYALEALMPTQILMLSKKSHGDEFKLAQMPFDISTRPIHRYDDPTKLKIDIVGLIGASMKVHNEISSSDLDRLLDLAKAELK